MKFKWKKVCKSIVFLIVSLVSFHVLWHSIVTETVERKFQENNSTVIGNLYRRGNDQTRALNIGNDWTSGNNTHMNNHWTNDEDRHHYELFNVISACNETRFPLSLARESGWRSVSSALTAYVFAAYYVETENKVIIIGIKSGGVINYFCQLWFQNSGKENVTMKEKKSGVITMSEGHGRRYQAVLFECLLSSAAAIPSYVSIVTRRCETPQHLIRIQVLRKQKPAKWKFTVCLSPLNFLYDRDYEMIEWIELNRILGAERFIVYNYSSGNNVTRVLDYFSKRGLTEVVQWNIPVKVNTRSRENIPVAIHYFGQVAALNDCLYRNKFISEFIVNLDLDEFIIPHSVNVTTWSEMLKLFNKNEKVYVFRNTFFKKEWDNADVNISNKSWVDRLQLVTLQKLQHERKISPPGQRSKYFARTNDVSKLMIHEVQGVPHVAVPIAVGFLHHYRNWETVNDPPHVKILDKTIPNKFSQRLIENVQKVWSDLKVEDRKN